MDFQRALMKGIGEFRSRTARLNIQNMQKCWGKDSLTEAVSAPKSSQLHVKESFAGVIEHRICPLQAQAESCLMIPSTANATDLSSFSQAQDQEFVAGASNLPLTTKQDNTAAKAVKKCSSSLGWFKIVERDVSSSINKRPINGSSSRDPMSPALSKAYHPGSQPYKSLENNGAADLDLPSNKRSHVSLSNVNDLHKNGSCVNSVQLYGHALMSHFKDASTSSCQSSSLKLPQSQLTSKELISKSTSNSFEMKPLEFLPCVPLLPNWKTRKRCLICYLFLLH